MGGGGLLRVCIIRFFGLRSGGDRPYCLSGPIAFIIMDKVLFFLQSKSTSATRRVMGGAGVTRRIRGGAS